MRPVEDALLPKILEPGPHAGSLLALLQALGKHLAQVRQRLNGSLPMDGTEPMTGAIQIATYTVATRPNSPNGSIIYVSDAAAGAKFQGRAGGAWVNLG